MSSTSGSPSPTAPSSPKTNRIGIPKADYEGGKSTLCLGCGHDVITRQIVTAFYEMGVEPHRIAKFSGIGCSSKTPAYFLNRAWGFNGVHGRMPSVATGALVANRGLRGIGVSGDGDTASIGIGQFVHLVRRNVPLIYIVENNGVYGLTKGQFSATADVGSKLKKGDVNELIPIDLCSLAIELGGTFVARAFSGSTKQLETILEAAIAHRGTAVIDVVSPCVTFNDHEGSTRSYKYSKEHEAPIHEIGFVPAFDDTIAEIPEGEIRDVTFPDGSVVRFHGLGRDYDPTNRDGALRTIHDSHRKGEILTGIFFLAPEKPALTSILGMTDEPIVSLNEEVLRPPQKALDEIMESFR
jgi:2-oxoglutarate/2-oxoacid ferredoxin oxidoreductase subunit beta